MVEESNNPKVLSLSGVMLAYPALRIASICFWARLIALPTLLAFLRLWFAVGIVAESTVAHRATIKIPKSISISEKPPALVRFFRCFIEFTHDLRQSNESLRKQYSAIDSIAMLEILRENKKKRRLFLVSSSFHSKFFKLD